MPDREEEFGGDAQERETDRSAIGPAFTPGQIIGGFALLAALLLFLRRRLRREPEGDD